MLPYLPGCPRRQPLETRPDQQAHEPDHGDHRQDQGERQPEEQAAEFQGALPLGPYGEVVERHEAILPGFCLRSRQHTGVLVPEDLAISEPLTLGPESARDYFLLVEDLDNIGCVFPHPDFPRE